MVRYTVWIFTYDVSMNMKGIVHVVNHPVLPPMSAFKTLFLLPQYFSIAVSLNIFSLLIH